MAAYKEVAEEVGLLDNLRAIHAAARAADIRIFIVPHRQWERGATMSAGSTSIPLSAGL
jgi:hypothetical protein